MASHRMCSADSSSYRLNLHLVSSPMPSLQCPVRKATRVLSSLRRIRMARGRKESRKITAENPSEVEKEKRYIFATDVFTDGGGGESGGTGRTNERQGRGGRGREGGGLWRSSPLPTTRREASLPAPADRALWVSFLIRDQKEYSPRRMYWSWDSEVRVRVGSGEEAREFRAPRHQLAQQSGYFKSLLESRTTRESEPWVSVPSIAPEEFAVILSYLRSGHLELTTENVYQVLLASHILHIPRAVEMCRGFLIGREEERRREPPLLVRPIPSRKYLGTGLYWPVPPPPPPALFPAPHFYPGSVVPPPLSLQPDRILPAREPPILSLPSPGPAPSTSDGQGSNREPEDDRTPSSPLPKATTANVKTSVKRQEGVVKDIASCDGPVRFKRVLNINYGYQEPVERIPREPEKPTVEKEDVHEQNIQVNESRVYSCTFCKHTFKSHYCYRKHTRRHINPVPQAKPLEPDTKDMNVQYYPCKTCGSKFPSYYFVHKHRKMCHVEENDAEEKLPQQNRESTDDTHAP